jgi:hypothetical protein
MSVDLSAMNARLVITVAMLVATLSGGCAGGDDARDPVTSNPTSTVGTTTSSDPTPIESFPATTTAPTTTTTITEATQPPAGPLGPRPVNGRVDVHHGPVGGGRLHVENGTKHDAVVTLAKGGRAVRQIYLRSGRDGGFSDIADGRYRLFYASGAGWNSDLGIFTRSVEYNKFDAPVTFTTRTVNNGVEYTTYEATLHAVPDGQASASPVSANSYPR